MPEAARRTLRDRLSEARRASFQGRKSELRRMEALTNERSALRVCYVHGPGGVGKTTLLRAFEALAARARGLGKPIVAIKVGRSAQARASSAEGVS